MINDSKAASVAAQTAVKAAFAQFSVAAPPSSAVEGLKGASLERGTIVLTWTCPPVYADLVPLVGRDGVEANGSGSGGDNSLALRNDGVGRSFPKKVLTGSQASASVRAALEGECSGGMGS